MNPVTRAFSQNVPIPRFQGVAEIKYADNVPTHISSTSSEQDEPLLKFLEHLTRTKAPHSQTLAFSEITYEMGDSTVWLNYLDNGVAVYISNPAIQEAGGGKGVRYHAHLYLTYETVSPSLHTLLRQVQDKLKQKLNLPDPTHCHYKDLLTTLHQTASRLLKQG